MVILREFSDTGGLFTFSLINLGAIVFKKPSIGEMGKNIYYYFLYYRLRQNIYVNKIKL